VNTEIRTTRLEDGRNLEYAEYGDPDGLPVLFFHGFLGSHHQARSAAAASRQHGLRLVAFNRPGVGASSPAPYRAVRDIAGDVRQLLDALDLEEVGLLAVSGGCPYALACACQLPERTRQVNVVSGLGPFEEGLLTHLPRLPRLTLLLSRYCPALARWLLGWRVRRFLRGPREYSPGLVGAAAAADEGPLADPELRTLLLADLEEVLVRGGGARTLVEEMRLFFNWGFRLSEMPPSTPVLFWHGTDDLLVPPSMARHMAAQLPGSEARFVPGGHFLAVQIAGEVAARLAHALRGPRQWTRPAVETACEPARATARPVARPAVVALPG